MWKVKKKSSAKFAPWPKPACHRLANVKDAGRILVLNQGQLVEEGRHEELLEKGGMYSALWKTQAELESYRGGEVYA